jgi:hypothetical protein
MTGGNLSCQPGLNTIIRIAILFRRPVRVAFSKSSARTERAIAQGRVLALHLCCSTTKPIFLIARYPSLIRAVDSLEIFPLCEWRRIEVWAGAALVQEICGVANSCFIMRKRVRRPPPSVTGADSNRARMTQIEPETTYAGASISVGSHKVSYAKSSACGDRCSSHRSLRYVGGT